MHTLKILLAAICLSSCQSPRGAVGDSPELDGSAIELFWVLQDQLMAGDEVPDEAWDALFATPAYRWLVSDPEAQGRLSSKMRLAFHPDPSGLESEISSSKGADLIRWVHYQRMRTQRDELGRYFEGLMSSGLMAEGQRIALAYLPSGTADRVSVGTPVHLLLSWPDAFADGGAVYLDLIEAYDRRETLADLIGHELHHAYYECLSALPNLDDSEPDYWTLLALRKLHMEGLADRIDKGQYPLQDLPGGFPNYEKKFNQYYRAAAQTLIEFDHALVRLESSGDPLETAREAMGVLHYGGHVEGLYMASTIADVQGEQALLDDVGDPFAFVRRFQSLQPTFSDETMAYFASLEERLAPEKL